MKQKIKFWLMLVAGFLLTGIFGGNAWIISHYELNETLLYVADIVLALGSFGFIIYTANKLYDHGLKQSRSKILIPFLLALSLPAFSQNDSLSFGEDLAHLLSGDIRPALWVFFTILAVAGVAVNILLGSLFRKKNTTEKKSFDSAKVLSDNKDRFWKRGIVSVILFWVSFLLGKTMFNIEPADYVAFFFGLGYDFILNSVAKRRLDWVSNIFGGSKNIIE